MARHAWVALVFALSASHAQAQDATRTIRPLYEVREHELPDLEDGSLKDWHTLLGAPTLTSSDFVQVLPGTLQPPSAPDLEVSVYLAWSTAGRIYAGFGVLDDYTHLDDRWQATSDGLGFAIDGDASGGQFSGYSEEMGDCECGAHDPACCLHIVENMRQAQSYDAALLLGGEPLLGLRSYKRHYVRPPYADAGGSVIAGDTPGWVLEMMVTPFDSLLPDMEQYWGKPTDSVPSLLAPGGLVGIKVHLADRDAGDQAGDMRWYSLDRRAGTSGYSDDFSLFELMSAEKRPTAVPSTTWGGAKASKP